MDRYNPQKIEQKWQEKWEKEQTFRAAPEGKNIPNDTKTPKVFIAEMFPYPSGAGLHVGHVRNFTIVDVLARFYSQQQMNVLRPFGYDTFGLPAENYAIKTGTSPKEATKTNIENFRKQMKRLGNFVDWSREINTSDPEYYRWTQWCFLQLYKKGLAYRKESYQWWCPVDQTVLANEQVENGHCWRCGSEVEKKKMKQWFFKITDYADELLADIDPLDWPEKIKTMQKNWIGRSEGAEIEFMVAKDDKQEALAPSIKVFTTRPDTIFGATFLVLAPEHPIIPKIASPDVLQKIDQYRNESLKKSEIERQENKEKTGVFTGAYAINPATGEQIPIWVSDYVLMGYGEGAIMAVPAHDERDFAFAEKFDLPIKQVIEKPEGSSDDERCYHGEGKIINSGHFNGEQTSDAREMVVAWLEEQGIGQKKVTYKMRDWLISRQRYWGCPIPIAYDEDGNEICYHPAKFDLPEPKTKLVDKNFISWYIDTILGSEEKVTLVAVGPLTDLGLLFRVEPKVLENIEEIVIMGGGHNQVNTTSAAEFNIYADPEAAEIVMQSGAKITMVPLDATHAASTYLSEVQAYRDMHSSVGDMVADLIEIRTNAYNKLQPLWAKDLCPLHDALAVAYLIDPNVLKNVLYTRVDVDISGGFADGHTIVDTRVNHNLEDNCYFALDADRDLFNKIMIERVGLFKD